MPSVSYAQTNFQGGEWSPEYQGRIDDKEYQTALALCLNYVPNQQNSLTPRSGFKRIGNTKLNSPGKLLPFRFDLYQPYVNEITFENMRLWANGAPILTVETASFVSVSGDPPTFVIQDTRFSGTGLVPAEWADGDSVLIQIESLAGVEGAGYLANREFTLNIVDASLGTVTLTDAVTGSPLTGSVTGIDFAIFRKILDLATFYDYPAGVRQIQYTSQTVTLDTDTNTQTFSAPDHRVTYLYPLVPPKSLSYNQQNPSPFLVDNSKVNFELITEKFIDGPYLDSPGTNIPLTVSGTSGTITVVLHGWDTNIIYHKGDLAHDSGGADYLSLVDGQKGNALPTTSPFINADWQQIRMWSGATTYVLGAVVGAAPFDSQGVPTIYYSKIASNLNHTPASSPTDWGTTPPTWGSGVTYAAGATVIDSGVTYTAVSTPVVGTHPSAAPSVWIPSVDYASAYNTLQNSFTGWYSGRAVQFYLNDQGDPDLATPGSPRLIRIKAAPQPWDATFTYATNDLVNYNDDIYISMADSNTGNIPDQDATNWNIQKTTIQWTWAEITTATDPDIFTATITLRGADLPNNKPIWEFRFGLYSDTTGWPTCGCYHEGRLWLASPTALNRFDASVSNQGFNFSPTAPDGTVADNNAISYTLNASEAETIQAFKPTEQGIVLFTSESEWMVSASSLSDPLTPTSIQAHKTTAWASAQVEPEQLPSSVAVAQRGGRRVLEYRNFIDFLSYQSRLNALDLTLKCQHLTVGGVPYVQYQSLKQPVIWCAAGASISTVEFPVVCTFTIPVPQVTEDSTNGNLFGIGYMRAPNVSYAAPFSFEHGLTLASGFQQQIGGIAVQRGPDETSEYLYAMVTGSDQLTYMEMMMPLHEATPFNSTFNEDGTINSFGTLASAYFVDSGVTPAGCKIASDGTSATFYGMEPRAGETLSFTILGKYVGDFTIGTDGSVTVPFSADFLISDIGRAMHTAQNATILPLQSQLFYLDKNGNSGVKEPEVITTGFYGQFGYAFRRRGQMLRPAVNGANGPAFGKTRRNHKFAIHVLNANEVSIGDSFDNLHPLPLTITETSNVTTLTNADFVTGVYRDDTEDDYDFDGGLCWEQTKPVPGSILGVGGFLEIEDV